MPATIQLEHRGQLFIGHVDHGCGPDDTYLRLYLEGKYVGWIQQVGDLKAELFVSSANGHTPRSQADHLDLVLRKAATRV